MEAPGDEGVVVLHEAPKGKQNGMLWDSAATRPGPREGPGRARLPLGLPAPRSSDFSCVDCAGLCKFYGVIITFIPLSSSHQEVGNLSYHSLRSIAVASLSK